MLSSFEDLFYHAIKKEYYSGKMLGSNIEGCNKSAFGVQTTQ